MYKTDEKTLKGTSLAIGLVLASGIYSIFLGDRITFMMLALLIGIVWVCWFITGKKWWGIVIGLALCFILLHWGYNYADREVSENSSTTTEQPNDPAIHQITGIYTAGQILKDYNANEVAADQVYRDKKFRVSGVVRAIKRDMANRPYVLIQPHLMDDLMFGIECYFDESNSNEAAYLKVGERISIEGIGGPYSIYTGTVNHSKVVTNY